MTEMELPVRVPSSESASLSPSSPALPSPATVYANDDADDAAASLNVRTRWMPCTAHEDGASGRPGSSASGSSGSFAPGTPEDDCSDSCPSVIDDTASAHLLMALCSAAHTAEWQPSRGCFSDGEMRAPYSSLAAGSPRSDSTGFEHQSRAASNRKRRANEDERIRHFGWTMVKIDPTKKGGAAGGHCWVHPVHGTATSKKAVFRIHSNEPPVKKVKPEEEDA
jgi:hypothetical protein